MSIVDENTNDEDSSEPFPPDEKELIESIENRDFESLERIENEKGNLSDEEGRRIFRLWKATEITKLDQAIHGLQSTYKQEIKFELCVYDDFFTIGKAALDKIKDFVSVVSAREVFRKSTSVDEKINTDKHARLLRKTNETGEDRKVFSQIIFSGVVLEVLKGFVSLYADSPIKFLAIFAEGVEKPLLMAQNCQDISLNLDKKRYLFIVDDTLYRVSLQAGEFFKN